MVRPYTPLHGFRYGVPGIYRRDKAKPYCVRFTRNRRDVWVGSFLSLRDAITAASDFLRKEQCHSPTHYRPTATVSTSSSG